LPFFFDWTLAEIAFQVVKGFITAPREEPETARRKRMHSKTAIRLLLTTTSLTLIGCGSDRQFVDTSGGNPDSSTVDAPSPSNDGSRDSRTPDAPSMDAPSADTASADRRDAPSSVDADAGTDVARDVTFDQSVVDTTSDILPDGSPDVSILDVTDVTGDSSNDSWNDAADASDATDETDCTSTPPPTVSPSGSTAICPGKTVMLTSSAATAYSWSTGATTQAILVSAAGSFSVSTTDNRGCMATSAPTVVTVHVTPTVPTISASGPTRFCSGGNVTLTASSAASYRWSTGATSQSIVVTDSGSYSVTTTNGNGCEATSAATDVVRVVAPAGSQTFNYSGLVDSFTVPECVTAITVDAYGAQGGNGTYYLGGLGGRVQATVTVVPSSSLSIRVGGAGGGLCPAGGLPGFNGGGAGSCNAASDSGNGGGATDVRVSPFGIGNRIVVAGAGGGAGFNCGATTGQPDHGGAGGGLTGQKFPSVCTPAGAGGGGSQVSGGVGGTSGTNQAGSGGLGFGGTAAPTNGSTGVTEGGGGGGGYYGGGGGLYGGGGGGSSYVTPTGSSGITHWQGVRSGHGHLVISW
jgi:Glycine rich protein